MCEPANPPSQCQICDCNFLQPKLFDFSVIVAGHICRAPLTALTRGALGIRSRSERIGGARRDRTDDLMLAKHALSQLSYGPVARAQAVRAQPSRLSRLRPIHRIGRLRGRATGFEMVGLGRLELPTSRLSSARSNQLSYKPDEASSSGLLPIGAKPRRKKEGKRGRRQGANCLVTMFGTA